MSSQASSQVLSQALYVIATPIGNLGDIVPRALEALQTVDVILAEDTRHSGKLLAYFNIDTPMQAYHDHSAEDKIEKIITRIKSGHSVALISDAGTPLISDPGYRLTKLAHEQGIKVIPIPGACAAMVALSASGLPTDRFQFEGFLPAKTAARRQKLADLKCFESTLIFYESPHRIIASLSDMKDCFGEDCICTMARELTKQFETIKTGKLKDILFFIENDSNQQKGEFVIIVNISSKKSAGKTTIINAEEDRVLRILLEDLPTKQAAALTAKITGKQKRVLYAHALEKKL